MPALILTIAGLIPAGVGIWLAVKVGASKKDVTKVSKEAAILCGDTGE